jgi:hypothetical protein
LCSILVDPPRAGVHVVYSPSCIHVIQSHLALKHSCM